MSEGGDIGTCVSLHITLQQTGAFHVLLFYSMMNFISVCVMCQ